LAQFGVVRLLVKLPGIAPSIPPNEEAYYPLYVRPQSLQATANESQGMPAAGAEAAAVKNFGDLPLIVLTGKSFTALTIMQLVEAGNIKLDACLSSYIEPGMSDRSLADCE